MNHKQMNERAALIELAAPLWRQGLSAREIGEQLAVKESRVVAIASENRARFPSRRRKTGDRHAVEIVRASTSKAEAKDGMKPKWPEAAPGFPGVTIRDRPVCGCEFPLWGHHEHFDFQTSLYCGAPKAEGRSYCRFHCDLTTGAGTVSERNAAGHLIKAARAGA